MTSQERNEKAREILASGGPKKGYDFSGFSANDGEDAALLLAIYGKSEKEFELATKIENERLKQKYPEIYFDKKGRKNQDIRAYFPDENATYITKEQFINLHSAVCYANSNLGAILNVHVIIHWERLGYKDHNEAAKMLTNGFFKPLHDWYNNHTDIDKINYLHDGKAYPPLCWIYAHEYTLHKDFHTHILTNIPDDLRSDFRKWCRERVRQLAKEGFSSRGKIRIVAPPSQPIKRQWLFFQYLCKGINPSANVNIPSCEDRNPIPMTDLIEFQGKSPGKINCKKQVGMSHNLNRKTRAKAGFHSLPEVNKYDVRFMYYPGYYEEWLDKNGLKTKRIKI